MKLISKKLIKSLKKGGPFLKRLKKCRLGAPDGLYIEFPDYLVDTGIPAGSLKKVTNTTSKGNIKAGLGHGMVIAVNEDTGQTRGSEYGRYDSANKGIARRVAVPNFKMANPGNPTLEELDNYAEQLDKSYGHSGGKTKVHYIKGADEDKMIKLMKSAESGDRNNGFYVDKDYRIIDHNCGTYGCDLIKKTVPWYRKLSLPVYSFGTPSQVGRDIAAPTGLYKRKKK